LEAKVKMLLAASKRNISCLVILMVSVAGAGAAVTPSQRDAEQMRQKIDLISQNALSAQPAPRRTTVSEAEINAYLAIDARDQLPQGVIDPAVSILGEGRVSGRATVDLDAVSKERSSGGFFDPMRYLTGQLPVTATGVLHTDNGIARLDLESAQVSGVSVPKAMLQQLLSYYSRSEQHPDGVSLDDPFPLPAKIQRIEMGRGSAVIVQ
jgi:hypothetical protein